MSPVTPRRLTAVILIVVVGIALVIGFVRLRPRVLEVAPENGAAEILRDTSIRIEFSQPMRAETVAERLVIEPSVEGEISWEENMLVFTPNEDWPEGNIVEVSLSSGARSALGLPVLDDAAWIFTIRSTLLAYLWPAEGSANLYALDPASGVVEQFTEGGGVLDFDVTLDGNAIYYAASNNTEGSAIYKFSRAGRASELVLDCGAELCEQVQVSPDGTQLAFVHSVPAELIEPAHNEIWTLNLATGETQRVSRSGHAARLPQWSPTGRLCFYDEETKAYMVLDLDMGETAQWANETGELGSWMPDGLEFMAPELFVVVTDTPRGPTGEVANTPVDPATREPVQVLSSHLMLYSIASARVEDFTLTDTLEDTAPVFSPDGFLVAFARKYLDTARWTTGRQLWVMRSDGTGQRALTDAPDYKHTAFAWSPDGRRIAYTRFNATALTEPPEIWLINLDGSDAIQLVIGGYDPQWMP